MPISQEQFDEMQHRTEAARKRSGIPSPGLPSPFKEPAQGDALERVSPREAESSPRFKIEFHVYACRPCDYDGYHIKELQDLVVQSGILPSDDYRTLRGEVIPHKVHTEEEEETRILIFELPCS